MRWWAVVNPAAGRGADLVARTEAALARVGVAADIHASESAAHVADLVRAGAAAGCGRFLAVGGDGTVNLVTDALMALDDGPKLLGILPAGSGCDFVRTFAIPQRLEDAARHLAGGEAYRVDVGRVAGPWGIRHFLNVAEAGLGAAVVERAARMPARLGGFRYKLAIWPELVRFPRTDVVLEAGRRRYAGPAMMVVFANGQFFGGGMNVAPKAMLVDGELDVQVFTGPKRDAVILQPRLTRGTHLSHPEVRRFSASRITLRTADPWPVEADGEVLGNGNVTVDVVPAALDIKI